METSEHAPNRLAREKSPYLLQHALNPVDWYPWGDDAFAKARTEDKPIFLSIGYSTCHWCHVMERESFEDDAVAELLNRWFVPVKVDREERPDVDRLYMTAMQVMGLGGGWPLNVFLTPDLEPFYGGTYFPRDQGFGRPGMLQVLPRVHEVWSTERDAVRNQGAQLLKALAAHASVAPETVDRRTLLDRAFSALDRSYDAEYGGFGGAPRFPSPGNLMFLFRRAAHDPASRARALEMALGQLDAMRAGGIHDHLGGGFHRYATDDVWLVPHFEKMLYDQAQLAIAYLEAWQLMRRPEDAAAVRGIFEYVARDLTSPDGGFFSAEDADSEGEEGKFYVWTPEEIEGALNVDAELFMKRYGVSPAGNFEHGTSILHEAESLASAARAAGLPEDEAERRLAAARRRLLEIREHRPRPHLDDKVIASWNGLMIAAFARGARVLGDSLLAERATRAAEFAWTRLRDARTGALSRRWRDGEAGTPAQLDDHAALALGFFELHQAIQDSVWLERAVAMIDAAVARFADAIEGGFFESPAGDDSVRVRMRSDFDGAEPAGVSLIAGLLQRLGVLLDRDDWRDLARRTFDLHAGRLDGHAVAMTHLLVAMDLDGPSRHVVIAGDPAADDTRALMTEFHRRFLPRDVLLVTGAGAARESLARLAAFTRPLAPVEPKATAYVCVNYSCRLPVTEPADLGALLDAPAESAS